MSEETQSEDTQNEESMDLEDFSESAPPNQSEEEKDSRPGHADDLQAVFDVPVRISAILGRTNLEISNLLELDEGDVIELDRKVGEAIDLYVNNRLVARGEVVLVDEKLGVTMTEIISNNKDAN